MPRRGRDYGRGGWRDGEVWLDSDEIVWFRGASRAVEPASPLLVPLVPALAAPGPVGLPAPAFPAPRTPVRRRWSAERRRRFATRFVPLVALVLGSATMVPMIALRPGLEPRLAAPARPAPTIVAPPVRPLEVPRVVAPTAAPVAEPDAPTVAKTHPAIRWRETQAIGVPHAGRLVDGVKLPVEGRDWVTWDPVRKRVPNRANRLYGTDGLVRTLVEVLRSYRLAHPEIPRVLVGDLSRNGGGEIDQHASHENGLDVDVYYPRRDGKLRPPATPAQIDRRHAQDLLDRLVTAGAQVVFVGYSSGLRGPRGIVVPYPNHQNHMHVRIPASAG